MLRLEMERRNARLTQAQMAREAGLHPSTISQIEGGRVRPTKSELERLANVLAFAGSPEALAQQVDLP